MSVLYFKGYRVGFCACALTALIAGSAAAADLNSAPGYPAASYKDAPVTAPSWTGFYAGVNGGYGWDTKSDHTFSDNGELFGLPILAFSSTVTSPGIDKSGGFGGGQIGYNWQFPGGFKDGPNPWVVGVEADIQGAGIDGKSSANATLVTVPGVPGVATPFSDKGNIDWFGTVRARLGYAYGPALLYVTGGFAYGEVKDKVSFTPGLIVTSLSRNNVDTGYAVGGGIEYNIGGAWSVKAEYQYINLGTYRLSASATDSTGTFETVRSNAISDSISTVRAGINYHVNGVYEPLK